MTTGMRISHMNFGRGLVYPTVILTLSAAAIHLAVVPDHLQEYSPFGIFFLMVGLAQGALVIGMVMRPSRSVFAATALIALSCVIIRFISRTIGLPFGPSEKLENVQLADPLTLLLQIATANGQMDGVITCLLEIIAAILCGLILWRGQPSRPHRWLWLASTVPTALLAASLTASGLAAAEIPLPVALNMSATSTG